MNIVRSSQNAGAEAAKQGRYMGTPLRNLTALEAAVYFGCEYSAESLFPKTRKLLPVRLLQVKAQTASNATIEAVIEQTLRLVQSEDFAWLSGEPEFFAAIDRFDSAADFQEAERIMSHVRLVLGDDTMGPAELGNGVFRPIKRLGHAFFIHEGAVRKIPDDVWHLHDGRPSFVFPIDGMAQGMLSSEHFTHDLGAIGRPNVHDWPFRLDRALELIRRYDSRIGAAIDSELTYIIAPNIESQPRVASVSIRLAYFGGIAVNAISCNDLQIGGGIIHEFYHQRFWQWWAFAAPEGLPKLDLMIRSPRSGQLRAATVMAQALAIESELHKYYTWLSVAEGIITSAERRCALGSIKALDQSIPALYELLSSHVEAGTRCAAMLDGIMRWHRDNTACASVSQ